MSIEINSIVEGNVLRIFKNGAIISLPGNKEGFLHISEVSEKYTDNMESSLKEGQTVTVKITSIDSATGKIRVSIKRAISKSSTFSKSRHFSNTQDSHDHTRSASKHSAPQQAVSFETRLAEYLKISSENSMVLSRSLESKMGGRGGKRKSVKKPSAKK